MIVRFRDYIFGLLFLFSCFSCVAQAQIKRDHYTTANGLSDNRITEIIKDKEGFMWFSTWVGISRFDGYKFSIFKSSPGDRSPLSSDRIDEMKEDASGRFLWVKVYDNRIYRFDKHTETFTELSDLLNEPSLKRVACLSILATTPSSVWVKTKTGGLLRIISPAAERPRHTWFNTREGAPRRLLSDKILFFQVDEAGNVWIGTPKGLCILSGAAGDLNVRKLPAALQRKIVRGMVRNKGRIFLALSDGSVIETNSKLSIAKSYSISDQVVNHILLSSITGTIYVSTASGKLMTITGKGKVNTLAQLPDRSPLLAMYEDTAGKLWLESQNFGIVQFNPSDKSISYLLPKRHYDFGSWEWNATVFEDRNKQIWINIKGLGLMYYKSEGKRLEYFEMSSGLRDKELSNNIVRCFYDPAGVLWVSSGFEGLEKIVIQGSEFEQHLPNPGSPYRSENEVRGITVDRRDRLWLGTKDGQLYVFERGTRLSNIVGGLASNNAGIYSIYEDRKGIVWMGTKAGGLIKASPADRKMEKYSVERYFSDRNVSGLSGSTAIYCFLEDRKGRLWAGAFGEGLILITRSKGKTTFKTTANCFRNYPREMFGRIRHMAEDAVGNIWIATSAGLLVFNPDSGKPEDYRFKIYRKEPGNINSLGGNDVHYLYRDSRKQMWVLTFAGGLNLADGKDPLKALHFTNYSVPQGLPSDCLLSCVEDQKGNLWIAAQNGISRFSIAKRKFQNYGYRDGIHEAAFSENSCSTNKDGFLIFGTTHGFLKFNPKEVQLPKIRAAMVLTNFQVNSRDVIPGPRSPLKTVVNNAGEVVLDHDQNVISIDFSILDYYSTDKQNYACRLTGFDNEWRSTGSLNRATYTKLPPGDYLFEVKSLNEERYRNIPSRTLRITVLPPFWQTWWAWLVYLIVSISIIMSIRRVLLTVLKLRQRIAVEKGMSDLKLAFFTQVSHELRTPLTLILNPAEEVLKKEALSGEGRNYMEVVLKNTRRMVRMVNQLLDLRKVQSGKALLALENIELRSFTEQVLAYFSETINLKKIEVKVISGENDLSAALDAEKMEIVIYNLMANAIKFSQEGGSIEIRLSKAGEKYFVFEILDEGPGVEENELEDIFKLYYEGTQHGAKAQKGTGIGLSLSRELVELHGGKIYAKNRQPRGFHVIMEMPVGAPRDFAPFSNTRLSLKEESSAMAEVEENSNNPILPEHSSPLIILAEDNEDLKSFLANKLRASYRVETATNGEEALEKARELLPDLVLSDIMMPKMDGIELLDSLKNDLTTSHIPVVLLTAKLSVESQIEGLRYGADYYITKPFEMELLQTALSNLIAQRKKWFKTIQQSEESEVLTASKSLITEHDQKFLQRIIEIVEDKLDDPDFNIDDVADSISMSRSAFYKKFKSLTNMAPVEFVRETRLNKAKQLFDAGELNISQVAYSVGFNNPKYFSTCFKSQFQCTPTEYLKRSVN